jgi:hypothetical protein
MKKMINTVPKPANFSDEVIRDYAYHLYEQSGCIFGRESEDWLEAKTCLELNVPKNYSRSRLYKFVNG